MPHLGVSLIAGPHYGGTYQYNLSVVRAVEPLLDVGWAITAFAHDPAWRGLLRRDVRLVAQKARLAGTAAAALYRAIDRSDGGFGRAGRLHPPVRAIDASGCDLVLFPSQEEEAFLTRVPALVAVHDLMHRYERQFAEYGGGEFRRRERHYRALCERAAGVLVDSELGRRQVVESYGVAPEKIFVLPFTVPSYLGASPRIDARARYGLFERYVFYPAQFWEHKNHLRLLDAVAVVRKRGVPVELVLCGGKKNAWPDVARHIAALGLDDHVRVLGYVPNEDMRSLYEDALATVFVSLIGPTSIPPLEAMAVGSPLVIADVYAAAEQVGDAALLVNGRDVADIAAALERIWTDEPLRRRLAERGRARAGRWTERDFGSRLREIVTGLARRAPSR